MSDPVQNRTGVWMVGAGGAVATTVLLGTHALRTGTTDETGLISATPPYASLPLVSETNLVFGGWELYEPDPTGPMTDLHQQSGLFNESCIREAEPFFRDVYSRLQPSIPPLNPDAVSRIDSEMTLDPDLTLREGINELRAHLQAFRSSHNLDRIVTVNLASTEGGEKHLPSGPSELNQLLQEATLTNRRGIPSSILYALASIEEECPFVNFTPSAGPSSPPLQSRADQSIPYAGKDAKTGETLLKSVLAPMFPARNLNVLSWEGHNILGNEDGKTLESDQEEQAKMEGKSASLEKLLPSDQVQEGVRIDYVPSLGDWKTAWDHIHFEGFLNTRMTLQLIWKGSDSILAAPLVLDLVKFLEFADRRGETGPQEHLASFFKNPVGCEEYDFYNQVELLRDYADNLLTVRKK